MNSNLLQLLQTTEQIAGEMGVSLTIKNDRWVFQNHWDDELYIDPDILAVQGVNWLRETLEELVE